MHTHSDGEAAPRRSFRITPKQFASETTVSEREELQQGLCRAALSFIERDCPVYLEGFGLLIPKHLKKNFVRSFQDRRVLRQETNRSILFEKCYDLTSYHHQEFPNLVGTKELADELHPQLPTEINIRWDAPTCRRYLRALVKDIKREVVLSGSSRRLEQLGTFFALHNRQGSCLDDWFAGADIFLKPSYRRTVAVEPGRMYREPVYINAWEPLAAAYGPPIDSFSIDVEGQLESLGFAITNRADLQDDTSIHVSVFRKAATGDKPILLFCTDGLRQLGLAAGSSLGVELVFQTWETHDAEVPHWTETPLILGWLLIQGSRSKAVKAGAGLSCGHPLRREPPTRLTSIITTHFTEMRKPALSAEGAFAYINLVGLTDDEAQLAERYSPEYLRCLLEYKGLDQVTSADRNSLVSKRGHVSATELSSKFKRREHAVV